MRGLKRLLVAVIGAAACARMAAPPGGPPRQNPPVLLSSYPDSGTAPCAFHGEAEFRFDEVTNDAGEPNFGTGSGTLERLIILSPDTTVPSVEWHRSRITVHPRGGWRDHVVYHVELLAGLVDLHNNKTKTGTILAFTTCGPKPTRVLTGRAIDWTSYSAMPRALIVAYHLPDSLQYRAIADSTGRFRIEALPDGPYLVYASVDKDAGHRLRLTAQWDSVRVAAARDSVGEIWTFPHDSLPLLISDVQRTDSQTITVTFNKTIDPTLRLDTLLVRVGLLRDSVSRDTVSIGLVSALPKAYDDSVHAKVVVRDSAFRVDSIRRDSVARARAALAPPANTPRARLPDPPKEPRPHLGSTIVIRTRGHVMDGTSYWVALRDVRTVDGRVRPMVGRRLNVPKAPSAADSVKMRKADSVKKADSLRKADSVKKVGGPGGLFDRR